MEDALTKVITTYGGKVSDNFRFVLRSCLTLNEFILLMIDLLVDLVSHTDTLNDHLRSSFHVHIQRPSNTFMHLLLALLASIIFGSYAAPCWCEFLSFSLVCASRQKSFLPLEPYFLKSGHSTSLNRLFKQTNITYSFPPPVDSLLFYNDGNSLKFEVDASIERDKASV